MSTARQHRRRSVGYWALPTALVVGAIALANAGVTIIGSAGAAVDTIATTGTVGSVTSVSDNCALVAGSMVVSGSDGDANGTAAAGTGMTSSSFNWGWCDVSFGASNASGTTLGVFDNAAGGAFFATNPSAITESATALGSCATALGADQVGYKVSTGGTATINACGPTGDAPNTNMRYTKFPDTATTACTTTVVGNQTCRVTVGINLGAGTTAGSNTGQVYFTA